MDSSQRIIFVSCIHAFGGVERLILALSRFLHQHALPHTVVCFSDTIGFQTYADWPMPVVELKCKRNPLSEGYALYHYLRAAQAAGSLPPLLFDLKGAFYAGLFPAIPFHLHLTDPPSLLPSELSKFAYSLRHLGKQPRVSLAKMLRAEITHRINKRGASNARSVIAMTNSIANELHNLYSLDCTILRPGIEVPVTLHKHNGLTNGQMRILSVCRLEQNKRIDWILRALATLESGDSPLSDKIDWVLDVVGDGSQRETLQHLSVNFGIAKRVIFHGRISDAKVDDLFAKASLFLMPAAQGYGLPALEALARGIAVVLHKESGVSEILKDNLWVEIIEDGYTDLAASIKIMVDRICSHVLVDSPLPEFPSDTEWANNLCMECNWV